MPTRHHGFVESLTPPLARLYREARATVEETERAIAWDLLYEPPEGPALAEGLRRLVDSIRTFRERLHGCLIDFAPKASAATAGPSREDVDFYFASALRSIENDLSQLRSGLDSPDEEGATTRLQRERLCERAADIKGKFASAIAGATAALIAPGRASSPTVEQLLFPERAQDVRRAHWLTASLRALLDSLDRIASHAPLANSVARWRNGQRADRYAFADLTVLRGQLATLLNAEGRRALFCGDYYQIRRREQLLAERVGELESIHRSSWQASDMQAARLLATELPRMQQLACEIAALIHIEQLNSLIGDAGVAALRRSRIGESETAAPLCSILEHDDLRILLQVLQASVRKRRVLARNGAALDTVLVDAAQP